MSRAELARVSGLQRSTVSAVVDELIEEGWVSEGAASRSGTRPASRRSCTSTSSAPGSSRWSCARRSRLSAWPASSPLRGTDIVADAANARGVRAPVGAHSADDAARTSSRRVRGHGHQPAGASRPRRASRLRAEPALARRQPASPRSRRACGLPVVLENAANACALGRALVRPAPRRTSVTSLRSPCRKGSASACSSTVSCCTAVRRWPASSATSRSTRTVRRVRAASADAGSATPRIPRRFSTTCTDRARRSAAFRVSRICCGSPLTAMDAPGKSLERMARYLGFGLANLATALAPEVIVVIGEVTAAWDRLGPIVLDAMQKRSLPHIDDARRGDGPGGAAAVARRASRSCFSGTSARRTSPDVRFAPLHPPVLTFARRRCSCRRRRECRT